MRHLGLVLVVLAACGGDDGGGGGGVDADNGTDPTPWVGNWNTTNGTQSTTCPGIPTQTTQLNGLVVIQAGTMPGTIKTTANNCTLVWDINHTSASLESGQLCTVNVGGNNYTITWTNSSCTLNGTQITGMNTGASNNGCSFTQQYTLTKM